jgi:uncharacterized protein (DUF488 family)
MSEVATVGHSTHSEEQFIELLRRNSITAVADVRSAPFSRYNPQFNREALKTALKQAGIGYVFLGRELGARSDDPRHYEGERVVYRRLALSTPFQEGIDRILAGMRKERIALMCAEGDPITCHRTILVARELAQRGIKVEHILADGTVESHEQALDRLMRELRIDPDDLFAARAELCERAYREQERRIAYTRSDIAAAE